MNNLYEENGGDGGFYTVHNVEIKKFDDAGAPLIYNVQFNLTNTVVSIAGDEIKKEYAGTATVDDKKHILSLILKYKDTITNPATTDEQNENH